ncbi:hypothetical protein COCON_G00068730 [Conger conger]|uniref:MIF4G domain-containing protein n=1 Tax=Conger conger TaxID=82655 RepID=A0A9Q1DSX1_CONCO|nr:hypothetical protein COCON_G00068730 [Conger conger]
MNVDPRFPQPPLTGGPRLLQPFSGAVQLHTAENAWRPSASRLAEGSRDRGEEAPEEACSQVLFRKMRGILNKLTPEVFPLMAKQAIAEVKFCSIYAQLCYRLREINVPSSDSPAILNFRLVLLKLCQLEFEKLELATTMGSEVNGHRNWQHAIFWGKDLRVQVKPRPGWSRSREATGTQELYKSMHSILDKLTHEIFGHIMKQVDKLHMDTEERLRGIATILFKKAISEPGFSTTGAKICHCLRELLITQSEVALERLCCLLSTFGSTLDCDEQYLMDGYIHQMEEIITTKQISSQVSRLMQDIVALRKECLSISFLLVFYRIVVAIL